MPKMAKDQKTKRQTEAKEPVVLKDKELDKSVGGRRGSIDVHGDFTISNNASLE